MAVQLGVAAVGAGMSYFQGKKMENDAQARINAFRWQELTNPFKTQKVSTLGSELQTEQNQIMGATAVDALRKSGTRGIIGGLPTVIESSNDMNRRIAANLDEQQKAIDNNASQRETEIQNMKERRQAEELSGYANALNVGMGMKYQGINQAVNVLGAAGAQYGAAKAEGDTSFGAVMGFGSRKPAPVTTGAI